MEDKKIAQINLALTTKQVHGQLLQMLQYNSHATLMWCF
jgi:hypothetical protein